MTKTFNQNSKFYPNVIYDPENIYDDNHGYWDDYHEAYRDEVIINDLLSQNGMHLEVYDDEKNELINIGYLADNPDSNSFIPDEEY